MYKWFNVLMNIYSAINDISSDEWICVVPRIARLILCLRPEKWDTSLQSNAVSHWLDTSLELKLHCVAIIPAIGVE